LPSSICAIYCWEELHFSASRNRDKGRYNTVLPGHFVSFKNSAGLITGTGDFEKSFAFPVMI
jgi:hypothetical protein